ncbi:glycosyltransferase family 2 protein [Paenibacillus sp. sgz5001063]|uniref:glycosyltransferase family 2 protein n=1 Tax=Paenibacillus sp. sgz5001063 TaxID=3242474 RepID=UPI0036D40416
MIRLSVVAALYNKENSIRQLYESIKSAMESRTESYEIVFVNDGSRDRSVGILEEIARSDSAVKVIHFEKNCGQTAAIWAGMKASGGELIALLDADMQTDPRDIFRLMPFIERVDFVNGKRMDRKGPLLHRTLLRLVNGLRNFLTGDSLYDAQCPMKLMRREVADSFHLYSGMHRYLPTLAKMNGYSVIEVSVSHQGGKDGGYRYGAFNRIFVGFMDAVVIGRLQKRVIHYRIKGD